MFFGESTSERILKTGVKRQNYDHEFGVVFLAHSTCKALQCTAVTITQAGCLQSSCRWNELSNQEMITRRVQASAEWRNTLGYRVLTTQSVLRHLYYFVIELRMVTGRWMTSLPTSTFRRHCQMLSGSRRNMTCSKCNEGIDCIVHRTNFAKVD